MTDKFGLSQDQKIEIREAFVLFDKNNDGKISTLDLSIVLRCLGILFSEDEIQEFLKELDSLGSGFIEFEKFNYFIAKRMKEPFSDDELRDAFRVLDKEGNGFITATEIRHVLTNLCDKLTDEEVDEMIKDADVDGDGMINYEVLVTLMTQSK